MRNAQWILDRRVLSTVLLATASLLFYMLVLVTVPLAAKPGGGTNGGETTNGHKITICHKDRVTITIDYHAWPAHQRHGDSVGACTTDEPSPPPNGDLPPEDPGDPIGVEEEPISGAAQSEGQKRAAKSSITKVPTCDGGSIEINNEEKRILQLHNEARKERGLEPLCVRQELQTAAREHSKDMAKSNYLGHNSPNGETSGDRLKRYGYNWRAFGENVAWGSGSYSSADSRFKAWMHSPRHRANIFRDFKEVGIGVATSEKNGDRRIFYTVEFGTKRR